MQLSTLVYETILAALTSAHINGLVSIVLSDVFMSLVTHLWVFSQILFIPFFSTGAALCVLQPSSTPCSQCAIKFGL